MIENEDDLKSDSRPKKKGGRKKILNHIAAEGLKAVRDAKTKLNKIKTAGGEGSKKHWLNKDLTLAINLLEQLAYSDSTVVDEKLSKKQKDAAGAERSANILSQNEELIKSMVIEAYGNVAIARRIRETTGLTLSPVSVAGFARKFKKSEEFKEKVQEYRNGMDDIRIYGKRGRLEEIQSLYLDAYDRYELKKDTTNMNSLLKLLEQARKEADVSAQNININNGTIVNNLSVINILQSDERKRVFKHMPINEIIIGRVAAKMGKPTAALLESLHTSFYSKQAGMMGLDTIDEPYQYPSSMVYDINALKDDHDRNKLLKEAKKKEGSVSIVKKPKDMSKFRKELIHKLKEKRRENDKKK